MLVRKTGLAMHVHLGIARIGGDRAQHRKAREAIDPNCVPVTVTDRKANGVAPIDFARAMLADERGEQFRIAPIGLSPRKAERCFSCRRRIARSGMEFEGVHDCDRAAIVLSYQVGQLRIGGVDRLHILLPAFETGFSDARSGRSPYGGRR